ncbi:hypothetical protein SAMN05421762_1183 [Pseudooceanicola nitratireducens]|uniref:SMODS and SLOG-associating 2TM effector domain-containing protein n=1 Tax=Pseudooceanicola nitratireducens TaxID=517719 RepID=A0A1I1JT78_9RHOB|nr:SLATT domain-containing protein [Pseudooceanicola nitratireducens]SEJ52136.1 hypothetical protein SAMN05216183_103610 [Pseudooceanicola nitratireducens]SFC51774.1 hypothetical protein SAMN05421762_1183 [Pseudooceanicola nitratireducens]
MTAAADKEIDLEYYERLVGKIEKTAYIRFNLSERLEAEEKASMAFSSVLTIFLVCASIGLYADSSFADTVEGHAVSLISIVASISLLVVNLLDYSKGRSVLARDMQVHAQRLLRISGNMRAEIQSVKPEEEVLRASLTAFHDCIEGFGQNHSAWDNKLFEAIEAKRNEKISIWVPGWFSHKFLWVSRLAIGWWFHTVIFVVCAIGFYLLACRAASFLIG